jgi:hypothetical protein
MLWRRPWIVGENLVGRREIVLTNWEPDGIIGVKRQEVP